MYLYLNLYLNLYLHLYLYLYVRARRGEEMLLEWGGAQSWGIEETRVIEEPPLQLCLPHIERSVQQAAYVLHWTDPCTARWSTGALC